MRIVGIERVEPDHYDIHTIDVWFSQKRGKWIIERLNADGDTIGHAHVCESLEDAETCLAEWLRAHDETHLMAPSDPAPRTQLRHAA